MGPYTLQLIHLQIANALCQNCRKKNPCIIFNIFTLQSWTSQFFQTSKDMRGSFLSVLVQSKQTCFTSALHYVHIKLTINTYRVAGGWGRVLVKRGGCGGGCSIFFFFSPTRELNGVFQPALPGSFGAACRRIHSCSRRLRSISHRTLTCHSAPRTSLTALSQQKKKKKKAKRKKMKVFSAQLMGGGHRVHIVQLDFCFVTRLLCALFVALGSTSDMLAEVLAQWNQGHEQIPTIFYFYVSVSRVVYWRSAGTDAPAQCCGTTLQADAAKCTMQLATEH